VLRITLSTSEKKVLLKLEGRLAGPWVDELRKTVLQNDVRRPLEFDVSGLTFAESDGEQALAWLHGMGARFVGKGPFPRYLFDRLKISVFPQESVDEVKTRPASRTRRLRPKQIRTKPQR
jgi:hypothetical protein